MPAIGYVAVPTIAAANPLPLNYGGMVNPAGVQTNYTQPTVAMLNAIRANAKPRDFGERTKTNGPAPDTLGDGGY